MIDILILLTVLAAWFLLNLWVLPKFGIQTCLSGFCKLNPHTEGNTQYNAEAPHSEPVNSDDIHGSRLQ